MPALYNTVGDLKFYNFISNRYPSGVPAAMVRQFVSNAGVNRWLEDYAFIASERAVGDWRNPFNASIYFTFPRVVGTPTENETITSNTTSNYRFLHRNYGDDRGIGVYQDSVWNHHLNTRDTGGTTLINQVYIAQPEGNINSTSVIGDRYDWFTFCVKSPTTLVTSQIVTTTPMGSLEEQFRYSQISILGWMHDSVFPSPPVNETFRYSSLYIFNIYDAGKTTKSYNTSNSVRVNQKASTTRVTLFPKYYPINCITGSYTAGRFLTDLILIDSTDPFQQVGKVDNRVACLGRGDFVKGRVYEVSDVFGRTGVEHWLCFCAYTPSSMSFPTWTPTTTLSPDKWSYWNDANNETDYIMLRVYVEGDL